MPKQKGEPKNLTYLHELVLVFPGRGENIVCVIEAAERARIIDAVSDSWEDTFYETDLAEGLECMVNTSLLEKILILDYLPGIRFYKKRKISARKFAQQIEEREASAQQVYVRIWTTNQAEPDVHAVEYGAWGLARLCLSEGEKFIHFIDEDGEDVLYPTVHVQAVEACDPYFLAEKHVQAFLEGYRDRDDVPNVEFDTDDEQDPA